MEDEGTVIQHSGSRRLAAFTISGILIAVALTAPAVDASDRRAYGVNPCVSATLDPPSVGVGECAMSGGVQTMNTHAQNDGLDVDVSWDRPVTNATVLGYEVRRGMSQDSLEPIGFTEEHKHGYVDRLALLTTGEFWYQVVAITEDSGEIEGRPVFVEVGLHA